MSFLAYLSFAVIIITGLPFIVQASRRKHTWNAFSIVKCITVCAIMCALLIPIFDTEMEPKFSSWYTMYLWLALAIILPVLHIVLNFRYWRTGKCANAITITPVIIYFLIGIPSRNILLCVVSAIYLLTIVADFIPRPQGKQIP